MSLPSLCDFFALSHPPDDGSWVWLEFSKRIEQLGTRAINEMIHEVLHPSVPIPFRVRHGSQFPSVIGNAAGSFICRRQVRELLDDLGATGYSPFDVVAYDSNDSCLISEDIVWMRTHGRAGEVDLSRGIHLQDTNHWRYDIELTDACGLYFDITLWDGSDIFMPGHYKQIIVTHRVAGAIQSAGMAGLEVVPVLEYGQSLRDYEVRMLKKRFPDGVPKELRLDEPPGAGDP